ncbi:MAG TPA: hypothetical protein VF222_07525 [Nitrososphaeraceae archaeon]
MMISDHLKYTSLFKTYDPFNYCKDVGDKVCDHTLYGQTEEELFENVKED